MASRSYERLSIEEFGRHLITSGDLDPVYIALKPWTNRDLQKRWLLGYWCFYDCGVASYLAEREGDAYWAAMATAAENVQPAPTGGRWTRGKERRHFRGRAALKAVRALEEAYSGPEQMADYCAAGKTCSEVMKRAKEHYLFGDWISFKVADMLERVMGHEIHFSSSEVMMFRDPLEAALILWKQKAKLPENAKILNKDKAVQEVITYLMDEFKFFLAPPSMDRPIGFQEVETVLCKWKSHIRGHYPLNNDIDEIRERLEPWIEHSDVAKEFMECVPQ